VACFSLACIALLIAPGVNADVLEKKTFTRTRDGIVVVGELLPNFLGEKIKSLRLYAYHDSDLKPIPFQIDELTPDRETYILPQGPKPNLKLGDGLLSSQDELVFMAFDIGDRVSKNEWIKGYRKGEEIEITDPLTGGKGWVYLFAFDTPPLLSKGDYVRWDEEKKEVVTKIFINGYTPGEEDIHFTKIVAREAAGGGVDFVDRLKIRMRFELVFPPLKLNFNEENTGMEIFRSKDGPIRVIRVGRIFFRLMRKIKVPAGRVMEIYYESYGQGPTVFNIPRGAKTILKRWIIDVGVDLSPEAYGMKFYSSNNLKGVTIDGKMSPEEKALDLTPSRWHAVTGKQGTYLNRMLSDVPPPRKLDIGDIQRYCDDTKTPDPPEKYPGCIGFFGFRNNFTLLSVKKLKTSVLFYVPRPNFKPGDQVEFLNIEDHPPLIKTEKKKGKSRCLPWHPTLPKNYFLSVD